MNGGLARWRAWFVPLTLAAFGSAATAQSLTVQPTAAAVSLDPLEPAVVTGDITNLTGVDLRSFDLFGSFSGYPDDALTITPLLGLVEFILPDRTMTPDVDLFGVQLLAGAQRGATYTVEYFFVDANGVFSNVSLLDVVVTIPEPPAAWLLALGLCGGAAAARRRRNRHG